MKQEFLEFLNKLMEAAPDIVAEFKTENIDTYIKALEGAEEINKPDLTENGKAILKFLQENDNKLSWKAREIAEGLFISSRGVSGSMRKLVTDGFVEKIGQNPATYTLTEKGKNYIIEEDN